MNIFSLLETLITSGALVRLARNRLAQFGTRAQPRLGATLLPAQDVDENQYTDDSVRYRTVVGNAGTRYSPVQIKEGVITGQIEVRCFHTDIGSEFTSRQYDALLRYLNRGDEMQAMAAVTGWAQTTLVDALEDLREVYRWQAIEKAQVKLRGDGYSEDVNYSNPAGHRVTVANPWSDDTVDPFVDIAAQVQVLTDKGYTVSRIITSRNVVNIMGGNAKVQTRTGRVNVNVANGAFTVSPGRASLAEINQAMSAEGLPPIEIYDARYRTQTGTFRYISSDVMILIAATGQDFTVDLTEFNMNEEILPNVLGYLAVGTAAGQSEPGRVIVTEFFDRKPPRIEGEAWEAIMPVIMEPEAIATLKGIS